MEAASITIAPAFRYSVSDGGEAQPRQGALDRGGSAGVRVPPPSNASFDLQRPGKDTTWLLRCSVTVNCIRPTACWYYFGVSAADAIRLVIWKRSGRGIGTSRRSGRMPSVRSWFDKRHQATPRVGAASERKGWEMDRMRKIDRNPSDPKPRQTKRSSLIGRTGDIQSEQGSFERIRKNAVCRQWNNKEGPKSTDNRRGY
ncbi:hypothetical protein BDV98DRAFT_584751 [Pterulicium gracile]|uniref:Uncharacterized protein n=1 Tax=Pterulicium gracile TaxID=1884261 RepID=A0A5C3Q9E3_9AGAR|nr:hypothetical protein BDV98DRAFT_584751 [Pterula gracilis]